MSQENGDTVLDLCNTIDFVIIQSEPTPSVVLSALCAVFSRWLVRSFDGDRKVALDSFKHNGIRTIQMAISDLPDEGDLTIH